MISKIKNSTTLPSFYSYNFASIKLEIKNNKAMKTVKMKTNVMCESCIQKVTPVMNETFGEGNWKVDITNPKKILTVSSENVTGEKIKKVLEKTGYKAEEIEK